METVFRGFMILLKQNTGFICMYFCIFFCVAAVTAHLSQSETMGSFEALRLDLAVVDKDGGEMSGEMLRLLKELHNVTVTEADDAALYEMLYYEKIDGVLCLEKDFEQKAAAGENCVQMTPELGSSYSGIYLEGQINRILRNVMEFQMLGVPIEECFDRVREIPKAKITISNGGLLENKQTYGMYFRYIPYLFLAAMGTSLSSILFSFRESSLKKRMTASAISVTKQNISVFLAFLLVGTFIYIITMLMAVIMYGNDLLGTEGLGYYFLNSYLFMFISLVFSYLVGILVKKGETITIIVTTVSLALSFVGGVFVPLEALDSKMKSVAQFLPIYWYENSNDLLMAPAGLTDESVIQIWQGAGMQVLFFAAMLGISMAIVRKQQRE